MAFFTDVLFTVKGVVVGCLHLVEPRHPCDTSEWLILRVKWLMHTVDLFTTNVQPNTYITFEMHSRILWLSCTYHILSTVFVQRRSIFKCTRCFTPIQYRHHYKLAPVIYTETALLSVSVTVKCDTNIFLHSLFKHSPFTIDAGCRLLFHRGGTGWETERLTWEREEMVGGGG